MDDVLSLSPLQAVMALSKGMGIAFFAVKNILSPVGSAVGAADCSVP